jgi:hypothetical protein
MYRKPWGVPLGTCNDIAALFAVRSPPESANSMFATIVETVSR